MRVIFLLFVKILLNLHVDFLGYNIEKSH